MDETTSRHLCSASEVLLWIPIESGFAECDEVILSYSTRLRTLLDTLFELRRASTERHLLETRGPIERLQTVLNVQWTVVEDEQRLLVAASFDRSWESYFRLLADETGSLLDAIFCHCEGYAGNSCNDGFDRFMAWIRRHQKPCDFYFSAAPEVTSDDIRYYKQLAEVKEPARVSRVRVSQPNAQPEDHDLEHALWGLWGLRDFFPRRAFGRAERTEREIYDGAVSALFFSNGDQLARVARTFDPPAAKGLRAPDRFRDWIGTLLELERERIERLAVRNRQPVVLARERLASVQGGILSEYAGTTHGAAVLVQCDTPQCWRKFLSAMVEDVSSELDRCENRRGGFGEKPWVNVGLTYPGLERCGLPDEALLQLPKEFREGMQARAGLLGDVGDPDYPLETGPKRSDGTPLPLSAVDAVVLVQGRYTDLSTADLAWWVAPNPLRRWIADLEKHTGVRVVHVEPLQRQRDDEGGAREHFGFTEGGKRGSQPVPCVSYEGAADFSQAAERDLVALGEILLGHPNDRSEPVRTLPLGAADLALDGSFLVLRKLEQNVEAFRSYVADESSRLGLEPDAFKALLMGRTVKGALLAVRASERPNDYHFERDDDGVTCPHFAHSRRTNPRWKDRRVPRLLRRGFSYGPSYASGARGERGMLFMAYNANLAEQFETIQRWINGGNSTSLSSAHKDLVCGQGKSSDATYWLRCSDGEDRPVRPPPESFVRLRWGAYVFVPARAALRALAEFEPGVVRPAQRIERGQRIIERLEALERRNPNAARDGWKRVLEESSSSDEASNVWAAVRYEHGGLASTAYGVLVAKLDHAVTVLRDDGRLFSVRAYATRLERMIGPHYLGLERHTREYREQAAAPNRELHAFVAADEAFAAASGSARQVLDALARGKRAEIHTRTLAEAVVGRLCQEWFELASPERLEALVFTSRYAFQVSPGSWVEAQIPVHRPRVAAAGAAPTPSPLRAGLGGCADPGLALTGAIVGFAAPAIASVVAILDRWAGDGTLWRLAVRLPAGEVSHADARQVLLGPILEALRVKPIPSLVYRTAGKGARLGDRSIPEGTPVIVGLSALCDEARERGLPSPEQWLFGGEYTAAEIEGPVEEPAAVIGAGTSHGCPARDTSLAVLSGVLAAVLERSELRVERRCVLSYR